VSGFRRHRNHKPKQEYFKISDDNRVSATLSDQDLTDILGAVATIRAQLPFLVTLSPHERREMAKMGDKSVGFDEKCTAYMASHPEFLPGFVLFDEIGKDRELRAQMMWFFAELNGLAKGVDATLLVVSSEVWMADLAYYQSVREAARRNKPGAKGIYEDFRQRFPGSFHTAPAPVAVVTA